MKKNCYRGIAGNGEIIIRQLEKEGGVNKHNLRGDQPENYYFVDKHGAINSDWENYNTRNYKPKTIK